MGNVGWLGCVLGGVSRRYTSECPKSLWTCPGKTVIYRPHEVAFCANADRDFGDGLQEPSPDDRSFFWPDDDSAAADGLGNGVSCDGSWLSITARWAHNDDVTKCGGLFDA